MLQRYRLSSSLFFHETAIIPTIRKRHTSHAQGATKAPSIWDKVKVKLLACLYQKHHQIRPTHPRDHNPWTTFHTCQASGNLQHVLGKSLNELVPNTRNRTLEFIKIGCLPVRGASRYCVISSESYVQNVGLVMAIVSIDASSVAGGGERKTCFANQRRTVVTIGVAPHPIDLYAISTNLVSPGVKSKSD